MGGAKPGFRGVAKEAVRPRADRSKARGRRDLRGGGGGGPARVLARRAARGLGPGRARAVRAVRHTLGDSYQVAADGPVELYVDLVDAFLSYEAAAERHAMFGDRYGGRWSPIPMFASVYHEYVALIGLGPTLTGVVGGPEDLEAHHAAEAVSGRDFSTQFCFEIACATIWGRQLALSQFSTPQGREERNRRKLAFVAAAVRAQNWGMGATLGQAEFMGLLSVDGAGRGGGFSYRRGEPESGGGGSAGSAPTAVSGAWGGPGEFRGEGTRWCWPTFTSIRWNSQLR